MVFAGYFKPQATTHVPLGIDRLQMFVAVDVLTVTVLVFLADSVAPIAVLWSDIFSEPTVRAVVDEMSGSAPMSADHQKLRNVRAVT